jgi:hypothetical protein
MDGGPAFVSESMDLVQIFSGWHGNPHLRAVRRRFIDYLLSTGRPDAGMLWADVILQAVSEDDLMSDEEVAIVLGRSDVRPRAELRSSTALLAHSVSPLGMRRLLLEASEVISTRSG